MRHRPAPENSRRVVATTLALWGGSVALAAAEGVFAKLSPATLATLALFALAYAASIFAFDRGVRGIADALGGRALAIVALALDLLVGGAALVLARIGHASLASLAQPGFAWIAFFVAPVALVASLAAARRALRSRRVRSAPARSPGARPAAT